MNILLINVHSSYNAGDAALTQATIDQLRSHFPGSSITLFMNDPKSHQGTEQTAESFLTWVNRPGKQSLLRLIWLVLISIIPALTQRIFGRSLNLPIEPELNSKIKYFTDADLVVSTAGGYLYSYGKGRALLTLFYTMALAILAGKPLYLFPQSYGPFQHWFEYSLARIILSRARAVMAREPVSYQFLEILRIPPAILHLVPDVAFSFEPAPTSEAIAWLQSHEISIDESMPLLGITPIDWQAQYSEFTKQNRYEEALAAAIRKFSLDFNGKAILFPQCWGPTDAEDDRIPARRIAQLVGDPDTKPLVVEIPLQPALLKSLYGQMDIFIGTRMHSNIFALSQYVPILAIGYLHKTQGIATTVGIGEWVVDISEIEVDKLSSMMTNLWSGRKEYREKLKERMGGVIAQSLHAGEIVAQDFNKLHGGSVHV